MKHQEQTPKRVKFFLLMGRLSAITGALLFFYGMFRTTGSPEESKAIAGAGVLMFVTGAVSVLVARFVRFWFYS